MRHYKTNKIYMGLRRHLPLLCVALGTLSFAGCSEFLDLKPLNEIVLENYWTEKADVENVVMSCYQGLETKDCITRMSVWGEMRSDNMTSGTGGDDEIVQLMKGNLLPSSSFSSWTAFYTVINRCNTVLYYAPKVQKEDPNYKESELKAHLAEVTALRDLCYFYLIRTFRDVPYVTTPSIDDKQNYEVAAAPFDSILGGCIKDLEEVKDDAVKKYAESSDNVSRVTRYSIYAILADMYLWKQDYANCIKYCDLILKYKKDQYDEERLKNSNSVLKLYGSYPLIPEQISGTNSGNTYNTIFGTANTTSEDVPFENIFQLYFSNTATIKNTFVNQYYGSTTAMGSTSATEALFKDAMKGNNEVFKKTDCRYLEDMEEDQTGFYRIDKYVYTNISFNNTTSSSDIKVEGSKWSASNNGSPWILYRLSDIMLMKAEAEVEMAGDVNSSTITPEAETHWRTAFALVGATYKRANNLTESSSDTLKYSDYATTRKTMEELVLLERRRELLFEGKRWFDLVRLARRDGSNSRFLGYAVAKYSDNQSAMRKKLNSADALYFPYSKNELKINPKLKQNPAYDTEENSSITK
jgi:hypothetical protein